jgi:hypothetical protein
VHPAKAITRVPVQDLCCLRAQTPAAPLNITLTGISGGATLTGPADMPGWPPSARSPPTASSAPITGLPTRAAGMGSAPGATGPQPPCRSGIPSPEDLMSRLIR